MSAPKLPDGFFWEDGRILYTRKSFFARNSSSGNRREYLATWLSPDTHIRIWSRTHLGWKDGPIATTPEEAQAIMVQLLYLGELAVGPEGD